MTSRAQFKAAIQQASTPDAAAGLCATIHRANMKELFQELEENDTPSGYFITEDTFNKLKAEYTA